MIEFLAHPSPSDLFWSAGLVALGVWSPRRFFAFVCAVLLLEAGSAALK